MVDFLSLAGQQETSVVQSGHFPVVVIRDHNILVEALVLEVYLNHLGLELFLADCDDTDVGPSKVGVLAGKFVWEAIADEGLLGKNVENFVHSVVLVHRSGLGYSGGALALRLAGLGTLLESFNILDLLFANHVFNLAHGDILVRRFHVFHSRDVEPSDAHTTRCIHKRDCLVTRAISNMLDFLIVLERVVHTLTRNVPDADRLVYRAGNHNVV